jgi:hypothetical protein
MQQSTFLARLPPSAFEQPVVAEVEIVELVEPSGSGERASAYRARVRVIAALKGVVEGQMLTVDTGRTSCHILVTASSLGSRAYIAGRADAESGSLSGTWRPDPQSPSGEYVADPVRR